jgi:hypothetical protein
MGGVRKSSKKGMSSSSIRGGALEGRMIEGTENARTTRAATETAGAGAAPAPEPELSARGSSSARAGGRRRGFRVSLIQICSKNVL